MNISAAPRDAGVSHRDDLTQLARGSLVNVAGMVVFGLLNLAVTVLLGRFLGSRGMGLFFEAVAAFTIGSTVAAAGADTGVLWLVPRYRGTATRGFLKTCLAVSLGPVAVLGTALAVLGLVFVGPLARVFSSSSDGGALQTYLRTMLPFLPLAALTLVVLATTRGFGTMVPTFVVDKAATQALRPLGAIVVLATGLGAVALALSWVVPVALALVAGLGWAVVLHRRDAPGHQQVSARSLAGELWRFSAPRSLASLFQVGVLWLDVLLVGALGSAQQAGVYSAVSRLVWTVAIPLSAIVQAIAPQVSGLLAAGHRSRARELYRTSTWWAMAASFPIFVPLAIFGPAVLGLFGRGFGAGVPALTILAVAMAVNVATGPVNMVLLMSGRSGWNMINTFAALAVNVGLNVLLIPRMGITGAAIAWAASIAVENLAPLVEVRFLLGLQPLGRGFTVVVAAAAATFGMGGLVARWIGGTNIATLVAYGAVASALYVAILWRFRSELRIPLSRGVPPSAAPVPVARSPELV